MDDCHDIEVHVCFYSLCLSVYTESSPCDLFVRWTYSSVGQLFSIQVLLVVLFNVAYLCLLHCVTVSYHMVLIVFTLQIITHMIIVLHHMTDYTDFFPLSLHVK